MRSLKAGDFGVGKRGVVAVREPWLLRQQGSRWTIYTFCLCYCGLSCGIFLTDGFRPNNSLPKAPPPASRALASRMGRRRFCAERQARGQSEARK